MNPQEQLKVDFKNPNLLKDKTHKYIFSNNKKSVSNYKKSMGKTVKIISNHLEENKKPFSGVSILSIKDKCDAISLDNDFEVNSLDYVLDELKELYINDVINFHHPKYIAHLNCPILIPTLVAEAFISSLNSSMDTWDQSTGGTFIELKLVDWTLKKLNYPTNGDGIFTSGGTQSNLMGLLLARDHYIKTHYTIDPKMDGLPVEAHKFKVLCSEMSHFSLKKT